MNTIKKLLAGAAIAAASILPAKAQQSNIELMQTTKQETSRIRPNLFYQAPVGIKGYTFVEFYGSGDSYFAKTSLNKDIKGDLDAHLQINNGTGFTDHAGLGLEYTVIAKDNTFVKVKAIPVYLGFDGKPVQNKSVLGFYANQKIYVPIVKDLNVVAFGEINLAAKGSPTWAYGEIGVEKTLDDFVMGLGLDLRGDGDMTPQPNVNVKLAYVFGQD